MHTKGETDPGEIPLRYPTTEPSCWDRILLARTGQSPFRCGRRMRSCTRQASGKRNHPCTLQRRTRWLVPIAHVYSPLVSFRVTEPIAECLTSHFGVWSSRWLEADEKLPRFHRRALLNVSHHTASETPPTGCLPVAMRRRSPGKIGMANVRSTQHEYLTWRLGFM
jgi:hypothetical protein